MTAWEELTRQARLGPATVDLLIQLTWQVIRATPFPPPSPHRTWSNQAILDLLAAMIDTKNGPEFAIKCAVEATDEKSLERLLRRTIRNWLIDQARGTTVGRMRRRLVTLLTADSRFTRASELLGGDDGWTLPEHGNSVWLGDPADLYTAVATGQAGTLDDLNSAGRTSARNTQAITDFVSDLLQEARGAVRDQIIARGVVTRFNLEAVELSDGEMDSRPSHEDSVVESQVIVLDVRDRIESPRV